MDKQIEAESVLLTDCKMINANAACSTDVHGEHIKREPEDAGWPEVAVNVSDAQVVKIEACDNSSQIEQRVTSSSMSSDPENIKIVSAKSEYHCEEHMFRPKIFQAPTKLASDKAPELNSRMENADAVTFNLLAQKQVKEEPFDCQENGDVTDSRFVKIEVFDDKMEIKYGTGSNVYAPAAGFTCDEPTAEVNLSSRVLNSNYSQPAKNSYTAQYKYSCKYCNYKCMYASNLKFHMMTHTGEKPFACDLCVYKCSQASFLKRHMWTHTGEKPYSCEHCDYKCSQARDIKIHMMNHSGVKQFNCEHCDYKCSQASHLKRHVRTHTGAKPYLCGHCDYKCTQADNLKRHLRTHTGEKPFKCDQCNYKCRQACHLKRHLKIHTDGKALSCDHCDYKCRRADSLDRHLSTHVDDKT